MKGMGTAQDVRKSFYFGALFDTLNEWLILSGDKGSQLVYVVKGRALMIAYAHLDIRPFPHHINPWWPSSRSVMGNRIHV